MTGPPPWLTRAAPYIAAAICFAIAIAFTFLAMPKVVHRSNFGFRTAQMERPSQ